ncbi:MAG: 2-nitropropane dioxygenase, partial [Bacteroidota bacterium]
YDAAERRGGSEDELKAIYDTSSLKLAAFDGDVARGKVEVGQCAGLIDDLVPAGELVARLVAEFDRAAARLAALRPVAGTT